MELGAHLVFVKMQLVVEKNKSFSHSDTCSSLFHTHHNCTKTLHK